MMKAFPFNNLVIYTDGSLTPEGAGAGVVVTDMNGKLLHLQNKRLDTKTNNEAEYAALTLGLHVASRLKADLVEIRADSEVIINQMLGNFAVKSHRLKQYHWQACELARLFSLPREENALADTLAGEASAGRIGSIGVS